MQRMLAVTRRELVFLRRHPWEAGMSTWLPCLMMALLAWQLSAGGIRELPIAVVDQDRSEASRELLRGLDASPGLRVSARPGDLRQAWSLVRRLEVYAVVYLPPRSMEVKVGEHGTVFAYYNASYLSAGQSASRDIGDVVDAFNRRLVQREVALQTGPGNVRGVPVAVQGTVLFNAARSYERFLLGLFFPALLLLAAAMAMVSAFGREFRDATANDWLHSADGRMSVAVIGKLLPYIALFMLYGMAGILWICARSGAPAGSLLMLAAGQAALYAAYGAVALLLVGATRDMGTSLSVMGLYAGTAMAFSAGTFPMLEAPLFARVWSTLLPFSHYVKLQAQQLDMGSAWTVSLWPLAMLLLFVVIAGGLGLKMVMRALPAHAGEKSS